jgi:hypothetical protein
MLDIYLHSLARCPALIEDIEEFLETCLLPVVRMAVVLVSALVIVVAFLFISPILTMTVILLAINSDMLVMLTGHIQLIVERLLGLFHMIQHLGQFPFVGPNAATPRTYIDKNPLFLRLRHHAATSRTVHWYLLADLDARKDLYR